jgi:hypothetical protein
MIKNYLYVGAILLIIAIAIFWSVSSYITSGTPTRIYNVTVASHRIADVPVLVNSSSISIIFVFASNFTNVYFMNQSAFSGLSSYLNSNSLASAYSYVASHNLNASDVFADNATAVKEVYQTSASSNASTYDIYAVIDSTSNSPSYNDTLNASVVYKAYSYGAWLGRSGESFAAIVLLIAGVAMLIYGAIKKPKDEAVATAVEKPMPQKKRRKP